MKIKLNLETEYNKTAPQCRIFSLKDSETVQLEKESVVELDFNLQNKDTLSINFFNKDGVDDNVIKINEIHIDDINIQHFIYNGTFFPEYNKNWYAEQVVKPPKFYSPCTELRHNGIWNLNITTPIWKMIMNEWVKDDR